MQASLAARTYRKYHLHQIFNSDDHLLHAILDEFVLMATMGAFLTQDLWQSSARSAAYSWRCINDCDVAVVFIGTEYGVINQSGVSQLHLSYNNAKTKMKPTLVFVHKQALLATANHRMQDLVRLIQAKDLTAPSKQTPNQKVFYFDDNTDLGALIKSALTAMLGDGALATAHTMIDGQPLSMMNAQSPDRMLCPNKTLALKMQTHGGEFAVSCHAHAFVGGALKVVDFSISMTLKQILIALDRIGVFTHQGLIRCLSELIDRNQAYELIAEQYPDVHAVSRCQILKSDAATIQDVLRSQGLVCPAGATGLWQLSDDGRLLVA